jgi:hypothetical protein
MAGASVTRYGFPEGPFVESGTARQKDDDGLSFYVAAEEVHAQSRKNPTHSSPGRDADDDLAVVWL